MCWDSPFDTALTPWRRQLPTTSQWKKLILHRSIWNCSLHAQPNQCWLHHKPTRQGRESTIRPSFIGLPDLYSFGHSQHDQHFNMTRILLGLSQVGKVWVWWLLHDQRASCKKCVGTPVHASLFKVFVAHVERSLIKKETACLPSTIWSCLLRILGFAFKGILCNTQILGFVRSAALPGKFQYTAYAVKPPGVPGFCSTATINF